jgi:hypothetical protein
MSSLAKLNQSLDDIIQTEKKSKNATKKLQKPKAAGGVQKRTKGVAPKASKKALAKSLQVTILNEKAMRPPKTKSAPVKSSSKKNPQAESIVVSVNNKNGAGSTLSARFKQQVRPSIRKI